MEPAMLAYVMSEAYRLATGNELSPEAAVQFLRNPASFRELVKSSGALDDPERRIDLEDLLQKETANGI